MSQKLIIDVRETDEYEAHHIPGSINIPLSKIDRASDFKPLFEGKQVCLMCKSGKRASLAKNHFDTQNMTCEVYPGGIDQWKQTNQPIRVIKKQPISIFRQVQIIVGGLVALFATLGALVNPGFVWAAIALGTALCIAGLFGFCLLATLLAKMPWNK